MVRPLSRASALFLLVTVLLTWPVLLQPSGVHLAAPSGYTLVHEQGHGYVDHASGVREYVDHGGHMAAVEDAAAQLRRGESPLVVNPEYTVPPTYVVLGAFWTTVLPLPTIVFHNLFFVGATFLAGLFAFLFVREVLDDPAVALLAGVLYMSSFYLFNEYTLGHTNQWQIQWLPLVLFGVERLRARASARHVALLGAAFALQLLSSEQYAVYLSFVVPLYVSVRYLCGADGYRRRSFWAGFAAAGCLAALLAAPYLSARLSMAADGATQTQTLADNARSWYVIRNPIGAGAFFAVSSQLQFLFRLSLLLLGAGAIVTLPRRRQRRLVPFAVLFGVGVALAWGPFASWAPYTLLYRYWPFVDYFRVPYRILPFALLGSSTLSAMLLRHPLLSGERRERLERVAVATVIVAQVLVVHSVLQFESSPL